MLFGLWFEPEMISEDSELFRAHPGLVHPYARPGKIAQPQPIRDRLQPQNRDNILAQMMAILDDVPVDYIKWDYNRNMTEIGTAAPGALPGEVLHKYMLGL